MEVAQIEAALGTTNAYWQQQATNHIASVRRAMDNLALLLDNIGTEGEPTYEDGMIACSGLQLGMFALTQTNATQRQKYLDAATHFVAGHRCLDQILNPDGRMNGGTLRFWESQYDILAMPDMMCSPHGWSAWSIYGRWYLYQLTGNANYLRQTMNALGGCVQVIDPASGELRWAFISDPFIQATIFANNPANTNPQTQGTRVSQIVGEQYLPMISGWCLAPYGTRVSYYSGNDGGCNDNDVHEIFKALEEVALHSTYIVVNTDGSVETWNATAVPTNGTLLVTPSETIVSSVHVNAAAATKVTINFNGQLVTRLISGFGWQSPPPITDAYHIWRQTWFGTNYASNPAAFDDANPAGDGLPNRLKFLLGYNPTIAEPMPLPVPVQANGTDYLQFQIPVNSAAAPAGPQILQSTNLLDWSAPVATANGDVILEQDATYLRLELRAANASFRFFRLAAAYGP